MMRPGEWCRKLLSVFGIAVLAVALSPVASAQSDGELVIGLIPEMNVFEQVRRYQTLADHLSDRLGLPIRLSMLSRYGNIVERILSKEVDAAFLGSFTGALVSEQLGWMPIARPVNLDGSSTYWGYLFVRQDSDIAEIEQMRGRRVAFVERATTAGYIFPVAFFREHGVDTIESFFSEVQFWGSHDSTIQAVLDGRADIGAAKNTIWDRLASQNPRVKAELKIVATSPKVPSNGLLISADFDSAFREQIRSILLNLANEPGSAEVLDRLGAKGFVSTSKENYQPVIELAREAGIDLMTYSYRNR